jgi:hypothetical protein
MSKSTAQEYLHRLVSLKIFVENTYKISVDMLMEQIKQGSIDAYDILVGMEHISSQLTTSRT